MDFTTIGRVAERADRGRRKGVAMGTAKWMLGAVAALAAAVSPGGVWAEGLKADVDSVPWARWQARVAIGVPAAPWHGAFDDRPSGVGSLSLMGDYYFSRSVAADGIASGFRATSGLIVGPRSGPWAGRSALSSTRGWSVDRRLSGSALTSAYGLAAPSDVATLPYVGVGYSGLSLRGGWSVNADVGVVALAPSAAVKLGRGAGNALAVDELLRDLRLSPVIQLGVSYSF